MSGFGGGGGGGALSANSRTPLNLIAAYFGASIGAVPRYLLVNGAANSAQALTGPTSEWIAPLALTVDRMMVSASPASGDVDLVLVVNGVDQVRLLHRYSSFLTSSFNYEAVFQDITTTAGASIALAAGDRLEVRADGALQNDTSAIVLLRPTAAGVNSGMSLPYGGTITAALNDFLVANAAGNDSGVTTLVAATVTAVPFDGTLDIAHWTKAGSGGITTITVHVNGASVGTFDMAAAVRGTTAISFAVFEGDRVGLQQTAGTDPGNCVINMHLTPTDVDRTGFLIPFGGDPSAAPQSAANFGLMSRPDVAVVSTNTAPRIGIPAPGMNDGVTVWEWGGLIHSIIAVNEALVTEPVIVQVGAQGRRVITGAVGAGGRASVDMLAMPGDIIGLRQLADNGDTWLAVYIE